MHLGFLTVLFTPRLQPGGKVGSNNRTVLTVSSADDLSVATKPLKRFLSVMSNIIHRAKAAV